MFKKGKGFNYYIHGAYWHNKFGKQMSHGCVNVSYANMEGLYQWAEKGDKGGDKMTAQLSSPRNGDPKQLIMTIFSVSEFIKFLNDALASIAPYNDLAIEGEVADFKISQGKWIWFDLKDESGAVTCFMTAWNLKTPLEDGMKVRVFGYPKIYQKSGKFSFTVNKVELLGEGTLKKAYDLLKKKLTVEGCSLRSASGRFRDFPRESL